MLSFHSEAGEPWHLDLDTGPAAEQCESLLDVHFCQQPAQLGGVEH